MRFNTHVSLCHFRELQPMNKEFYEQTGIDFGWEAEIDAILAGKAEYKGAAPVVCWRARNAVVCKYAAVALCCVVILNFYVGRY